MQNKATLQGYPMLDARVLETLERAGKPLTVKALVYELRTWVGNNQSLLTAYNTTVRGPARPEALVISSVMRLYAQGKLRRIRNIHYELIA